MVKRASVIQGIVVPSGWDKEGKIIDLAISGFDENLYYVRKLDSYDQLFPFLRKEVEIHGLVFEKRGKKWLTVEKIDQL
jgi:hypothetical protein